ncbi:hypothetical protein [Algoriphagus boritolerans]|uniref:hypothetical protein n=1 Tax=Algoriphagus boritolerans TaxID=308111 RepID=UPI000B2C550B
MVILSVGFVIYDRLGGNNPVGIELIEAQPPTLSGKTFKGQPQNPELGKTFQSIETLLSLHPGKKIHTIYFQEPGGKLDTLEVFVGLDLPFAPSDLETMAFSESRYLLATIQGNKWVMPSPNSIKELLQKEAQSKNLELSGIFIDRITSESEVQVIAPVK